MFCGTIQQLELELLDDKEQAENRDEAIRDLDKKYENVEGRMERPLDCVYGRSFQPPSFAGRARAKGKRFLF